MTRYISIHKFKNETVISIKIGPENQTMSPADWFELAREITKRTCLTCRGFGDISTREEIKECPDCHGTGISADYTIKE